LIYLYIINHFTQVRIQPAGEYAEFTAHY
jgi:hypothetical protein